MIGDPPSALAGDESAAETLFQAGLDAMKKNDFAVACEAFQQSNKADPSPGTQINLALCYEKQKKWASAWTWYRSAVGLAQQRGQAERERLAQDSAARLKPKLHNLIVSVKEPLTDLVVKRDGAEVTIALAGKEVPLPVDPGEHTIEVSARGKVTWSKSIQVADNNLTDRVDVPKLEDAPVETKPVGTPAPGPGVDYRPPVIVANDGSGQRTVGIVVAGAGLAAGLVSGGFYYFALDEKEKSTQYAKDALDPANALNKTTLEDASRSKNDAAKRNQLIAILTGVGAVALVATGAVLYFTAPKAAKAAGKPQLIPLLGPTHAGLGLGGMF